MLKRLILIIGVVQLTAAAAPSSTAATAPATRPAAVLPEAEVQRLVRPLIEGQWCEGLVVGLVSEHGSQIHGFGRISQKDRRPPSAKTVFEIGSVTKAYTGVLLARMLAAKQVTLDDPVQQLLPKDAKVPKIGDKPITLQHLATHMSGLPRMPNNFKPSNPENPYADYSVQQLYAFLTGCEPEREPGVRFEYSNLGMGLLGHALAQKAGKSFEALLAERIFQPLSMNDTRISLTNEMRRRLAPGHDADGNPQSNWDIPTLAGAGALRSTAEDQVKFLQANLGLVEPRGVPKAQWTEAIALAQARRDAAGPANDIALGWHINKRHGVIWHNGQTGGYHSYVGFHPGRKVGVVVLSNTAAGVVDALGAGLIRRAMGEQVEPPKLRKPVPLAADALDRYVGKYQMGLAAFLTITREGDRVFAQLSGQPRFRIYPSSETEFFWKVVDARVTFELEQGGGVDGRRGKAMNLTLHQNGRETPAARVE